LITLQITQPSKIIAMAKNILGKKTAILVTNASQKPVTVTMGFMNSSSAPNGVMNEKPIRGRVQNLAPNLTGWTLLLETAFQSVKCVFGERQK
jgi:hypothetical protein